MTSESIPFVDTKQENAFEEYGAIGVAVIKDRGHDAHIVHDFAGPIILDPETMDRKHSFADSESIRSGNGDLPPRGVADTRGEATIASEISTMTKNIIGCGVLSLSGGLSQAANSPAAVYVGNFWIVTLGAIFGYFCYLIAKVCEMTGRTTYRGIWQETIGSRGGMAISMANALKAALADLAYASILADTTRSLLKSMRVELSRSVCLIAVTLVAILPLCLLQNLHVLAPFSVVGTAGVFLTAGAMGVRYFDGSYLEGGKYYSDIPDDFRPQFGSRNDTLTLSILPFVCMTYEAYVMHYNSARFYSELKDRTLPRFAVAVGSSFGLSAIVYIFISSLGFLTFGENCASFILNNYSSRDPLAIVCRLAVGISTLTAYPIVFHGVRDGVFDVLEIPFSEQRMEKSRQVTFFLLAILTFTAIFITDLGLINAVGGGLVTTPIVFVFPTLMYKAAASLKSDGGRAEGSEIGFASILTIIGIFIGVAGALIAVQSNLSSTQ